MMKTPQTIQGYKNEAAAVCHKTIMRNVSEKKGLCLIKRSSHIEKRNTLKHLCLTAFKTLRVTVWILRCREQKGLLFPTSLFSQLIMCESGINDFSLQLPITIWHVVAMVSLWVKRLWIRRQRPHVGKWKVILSAGRKILKYWRCTRHDMIWNEWCSWGWQYKEVKV